MYFLGNQLVVDGGIAFVLLAMELFFFFIFLVAVLSSGVKLEQKKKKRNEIKFDTDNYPFDKGSHVDYHKYY